jgi:O-antigen/teichoic acid export membrane protein
VKNSPTKPDEAANGSGSGPVEDDHLTLTEVRQRAVVGAAVDVLRGFGIRLLGLIGTLLLARLLTPHDFGVVAVGATFLTFGNFLADGGVGTALIRRADPPARADLRALLAFQLGITSVIAIGVSLALIPLGEWGQVTALMLLALPVTAPRVPGVILLERKLNYRPLALVELVETACYYGWAIVLVIGGWGVWGLASASLVRALAGTLVLLSLVPSARLVPSPSWTRVRPLLGFGLRYQSVGVATLLRDQGINLLVALIAGVSALGVWAIAFRIFQIPVLFLTSLWRVSYPGMSRLVAAQKDASETIERVVAVVAVVTGVILAPLVAATPAWIPALLGSQWADAVPVVPPGSLHLMFIGPISAALVGYLWAVGDASAVLRATLIGIPLMYLVMTPLLLVIGVPAVGFGWLASGVAEATVLILSARRYSEFRIRPRLLPPLLASVGAASLGWLVATQLGTTIVAGLAGALLAAAVYLLALWSWHRSYLLDSVQLSIRGLRGALKTPSLE